MSNTLDKDRAWTPWVMSSLPVIKEPVTELDDIPEDLEDEELNSGLSDEEIAQMEEQRKILVKQSVEEGFSKGYEDGLKQAMTVMEDQINAAVYAAVDPIRNMATSFSTALKLIDSEIGRNVTELAMTVGQQLARHTIDLNPKIIEGLVRELLHSEPTLSTKTKLWVNPEDAALLEEQLGEELMSFGWKIMPDNGMVRGGCRVTSGEGEIDASWEKRVALISGNYLKRNS